MHICDVNNFYTPTGGGVRTYHNQKLDWYRGRKGLRYTLIVPSDRYELIEDGNVTLAHLPALPLGSSGYRMILDPMALRRAFAELAPDIVEVGSPYALPLLVPPALGSARRNTLLVGFYHADYPHAYVNAGLAHAPAWLREGGTEAALQHMGWIYRNMDVTFGASEYSLNKLSRYGVRRLVHTPLGVDIDTFTPEARSNGFRMELGVTSDTKLVLFLGRLAGMKRIDLLLEAWPKIREREDLALLVVGHGPLEDEVRALAATCPEIRMLPFLTDKKDVARAYASADAYLSLGEWETFSLTTLEALASGTPVIATSGGAAGELVRRAGTSTPFEPGSVNGLQRSLNEALGFERKKVAANTAAFARAHFSWDRVLEQMTDVYAQMLSIKRAGRIDNWLPAEGAPWQAAPGLPALL